MARARNTSPNILLVMFDQMAALSLPCYGHPLVRAPHLQELAGQGVLFDLAYCNAPLCSPSRHAMMTGRLPSQIGAFDNGAELTSSTPTLAHYLRADGYRTCLSGKMDFSGADQLHGFEERLTTDMSPSDFGWTANWDEPKRLYPWFHDLRSVVEAGPCDHSLTMAYDEQVTHAATRWLYDAARGSDRRPFLLSVSYMHPHDPYLGPRPFWERYSNEDIDLPRVRPLSPARRDPASRRLYALYDRGEYEVSENQLRTARRAYYAMIDYADHQLGRLLDALRKTKLEQRTLLIVTSDHGDMLGERGLWYKMTFFERAMRIPLLLHWPGCLAPRRVPEPVSLVDLLPTVMDIVGHDRKFAPPEAIDGRSLLGTAAGHSMTPGAVYAEYMAEGTDQPMFMIRRGWFKYISSPGDQPMLFDLSEDPEERRNLKGAVRTAKVERGFAAEVASKWDAAELRRRVIASQRARRFVHGALMKGQLTAWDFQPPSKAERQYYRNYGARDPERRFPPTLRSVRGR
jgi:choline-sulfatase